MKGLNRFKDSAVVNLYKPPGITSHQAARKVQGILGAMKAGHAGTLDPFAEGVLLVCLNRATRIAEYLSSLDKEYVAVLRLGVVTDTLDVTGRTVKEEDPRGIGEETIVEALRRFKGEISQVPPMFSAIKRQGVPLYRLARKGVTVEREARTVLVSSLDLLSYSPPDVILRIRCSKGTYIRSLARDIGEVLGVGAVVKELKRTAIGGFTERDALSFTTLERGEGRLYSLDEALSFMRELTLDDDRFRLAIHGTGFDTAAGIPEGELLRLKGPDGLCFAVARSRGGGSIRIEKVLVDTR